LIYFFTETLQKHLQTYNDFRCYPLKYRRGPLSRYYTDFPLFAVIYLQKYSFTTGLIKNFNFAEGNGDHTANLAEPEGNQAWCMGTIDTDYSWETVAQTPTNLRTENQTENSFDILWDGTDGNTWSVELSANGQVVDTKTRLTEKKASFSNLDKKDYTVRVKAHSFMETAFSDAFSVNLSTSSAITNIHKNISIVRHNNAIQIDGIQTGKLISIYTDQGILSRQISAEHETTVLSIEGFPHGIYFISIEGYGPTFKIAL